MKRAAIIPMLCLPCLTVVSGASALDSYRSPFEAKYSPDGRWLAVSDRTAGKLVVIDPKRVIVAKEISLGGEPTGVTWKPDGRSVFVSESSAATVAEVDVSRGKITRRFQVGTGPMGARVPQVRPGP
jgi:DNA-binding beta-propeller fold protein YncE